MNPALPEFIPPMLASNGSPFDSSDHFYEVKWDGIRCLAFLEGEKTRLFSRRHRPLTDRYPELRSLETLPPGTVLDGELVVLREGRPDFSAVLSREQARSPQRIRALMQDDPVLYMVFDLLFENYENLCEQPLEHRRKRLSTLLETHSPAFVSPSDCFETQGIQLFEQACAQGLEGIVAKRRQSRYVPGSRTDDWIKIKQRQRTCGLILGYLPSDKAPLQSVLVAVDREGQLEYAGRVSSGLDLQTQEHLIELFASRSRRAPLISLENLSAKEKAALERAHWVEPGLYCVVSYAERTRSGRFRAPVFEELRLDL